MNTKSVQVQVTGFGRIAADLESITTAADVALWRSAAELLRERTYTTETGVVRVRTDWTPLVVGEETVPFEVQVIDEREPPDARDAVSFVELFVHDVFLLLNIAVPGSFGGLVAVLSDGEHRGSEVALSARLFEHAWATARRDGGPAIEPLPLAEVIRWYDSLQLGTRQVAGSDVEKVLFHLLHLARHDEDEWTTILRLGQAQSGAPVLHPMANDALDADVDDLSYELISAADLAARTIVSGLQSRVRAQTR